MQLPRRLLHRRFSLCRDKIANRLRLGQVDFAIRQSTQRKLTRTCEHCTQLKRRVDNASHDRRRSVTTDLHDVLSSERMRRSEAGEQNLVQDLVVVWMTQSRECCSSWLRFYRTHLPHNRK